MMTDSNIQVFLAKADNEAANELKDHGSML
jgi:hypothetical protein